MVPVRPSAWHLFDRRWLEENYLHVLGVIMTTLFLGLGAPFWYNLLRQLGNLRPLLAGKVDKDQKDSAVPA